MPIYCHYIGCLVYGLFNRLHGRSILGNYRRLPQVVSARNQRLLFRILFVVHVIRGAGVRYSNRLNFEEMSINQGDLIVLIVSNGLSVGLRINVIVRRFRANLAGRGIFRILIRLDTWQYVGVIQLGEGINGESDLCLVMVSVAAVGLVEGDAQGSCCRYRGRR